MNPHKEQEAERESWLASLRPCDLVAVSRGKLALRGYDYSILVVSKVSGTKRRVITVSYKGGEIYGEFNANGERRIGGTWGHTERLQPITQEIKDHISHYKLSNYLQNTKWETLGPHVLQEIKAVLDRSPEGTK